MKELREGCDIKETSVGDLLLKPYQEQFNQEAHLLVGRRLPGTDVVTVIDLEKVFSMSTFYSELLV